MIGTWQNHRNLGLFFCMGLLALAGCSANITDWSGTQGSLKSSLPPGLAEIQPDRVSAQNFGLTESGFNETHRGTLSEATWDEYVITNVPRGTRYTIALTGPEESTDFDLWLFECGQWTGSETKASNEAISIVATCTDAVYVYPYAFTGDGAYELAISRGLPSQGVVVPCNWANEGSTEIIADCGEHDIIFRTLRAHQGGLGLYVRYSGQRECGAEFYRDETFAINCLAISEEVDADNATRMYQLIQRWTDEWDNISLSIGANLTQILGEMNGGSAVSVMLQNNLGPGVTLGVGASVADVLGSYTTPVPENTRLLN